MLFRRKSSRYVKIPQLDVASAAIVGRATWSKSYEIYYYEKTSFIAAIGSDITKVYEQIEKEIEPCFDRIDR